MEIEAALAGLLAADEDQAQQWSIDTPDVQIYLVAGGTLDLAELVEDELLLALPMRPCADEACVQR